MPTLAGRTGYSLDRHFLVTETGCWEWQGNRNAGGYGRTTVNGVRMLSHRAMWEREHGVIPDGMLVLHTCDNPPCINPAHLFLGTHFDNTADAREKGRLARGLATRTGKLTLEQTVEIHRRRAAGERGIDLAREYGVSTSTICDIHRGRKRLD